VPVEPPPPTLPANMKYFGYGTVPNGTSKRAFLNDGEEVFIVGEGDTLLGRFRIIRINNATLEFEEVSSGRRNSITLDETAAPPA
jgi:GTPase